MVTIMSIEQQQRPYLVQVAIKRLPHIGDLPLPSYATIHSAGMDLCSCIDIEIHPSERVLVPTGIAIALPDGYEAQIRPRSGLALKHGVTVTNAPGTVDADYRGEIFISLINLGTEKFSIIRGMRIAQMIVAPYNKISWNLVDELTDTVRGDGGFGSTGI